MMVEKIHTHQNEIIMPPQSAPHAARKAGKTAERFSKEGIKARVAISLIISSLCVTECVCVVRVCECEKAHSHHSYQETVLLLWL